MIGFEMSLGRFEMIEKRVEELANLIIEKRVEELAEELEERGTLADLRVLAALRGDTPPKDKGK